MIVTPDAMGALANLLRDIALIQKIAATHPAMLVRADINIDSGGVALDLKVDVDLTWVMDETKPDEPAV